MTDKLEQTESPSVGQFLELIYSGLEGYCYIATKSAPKDQSVNDATWKQHFFKWPERKEEVVSFIQEKSTAQEVYFAPALFTEEKATKEAVKGAKVFWCEFDGNTPEDFKGLPQPSIRVTSSLEGHEHWYWRTEQEYGPEDLEKINRGIAYLMGSDTSGWDAGQVLRPIETTNHKRGKPVKFKSLNLSTVTLADFKDLPEPPPVAPIPEIDSIPPIEDVISKYEFSVEVWDLFKHGQHDRSDGLMSLGYHLAEMQLKNREIFSMLINADERWGKFAGRPDQHKRLMEIVVISREKYPILDFEISSSENLESFGFKSLLATEEEVEWIWEGLLHSTGYMLITGPSGVGKTQFSLNAAARMALGQDFLGRKSFTKGKRIGIFSLEMGLAELKSFVALQGEGYTSEEQDILEESLRFFPLGEPLYLTNSEVKNKIEDIVDKESLDGLIFDSLGSVTESSLSSEESVKNLMDWNDRLRKRKRIFTWYIHHHRKASGENKKPNKLGDVYGSQYITARTSTVLCLWDNGLKNTVQCIPLKTRFTEKPPPFNMHRDKNLHFFDKVSNITILEETESSDEIGEEEVIIANTTPGDGKVKGVWDF